MMHGRNIVENNMGYNARDTFTLKKPFFLYFFNLVSFQWYIESKVNCEHSEPYTPMSSLGPGVMRSH